MGDPGCVGPDVIALVGVKSSKLGGIGHKILKKKTAKVLAVAASGSGGDIASASVPSNERAAALHAELVSALVPHLPAFARVLDAASIASWMPYIASLAFIVSEAPARMSILDACASLFVFLDASDDLVERAGAYIALTLRHVGLEDAVTSQVIHLCQIAVDRVPSLIDTVLSAARSRLVEELDLERSLSVSMEMDLLHLFDDSTITASTITASTITDAGSVGDGGGRDGSGEGEQRDEDAGDGAAAGTGASAISGAAAAASSETAASSGEEDEMEGDHELALFVKRLEELHEAHQATSTSSVAVSST